MKRPDGQGGRWGIADWGLRIADCGLADWRIADCGWKRGVVSPCANQEDPQPGWIRPDARCGLPARLRPLRGRVTHSLNWGSDILYDQCDQVRSRNRCGPSPPPRVPNPPSPQVWPLVLASATSQSAIPTRRRSKKTCKVMRRSPAPNPPLQIPNTP